MQEVIDNSERLYGEREDRLGRVGIQESDYSSPSIVVRPGKLLCKRIHLGRASSESRLHIPTVAAAQGPGLFLVVKKGVDGPQGCSEVELDAWDQLSVGSLIAMPHYAGMPLPFRGELYYFVEWQQVNGFWFRDAPEAVELRKIGVVIREQGGEA